VLPDDLDLRSDSESPSPRESFLSVSPEPDEESDSYISISPDEEAARVEAEAEADGEHALNHGTNGASSYLPGPPTEGPARPRERPAMRTRGMRSEPVDGVKSPTLPSPMAGNASRMKASNHGESVATRSSVQPAPPPGPTLEELARLLAPHSPMAKGLGVPPPGPPPPVASPLPAPHIEEGQPPSVDGLDFESVEALADLPEEAQAELASSGQLLTLTSGQEVVLREGAALITRGSVHVTLTYSDVSAARVGSGAVVAARGSVEAGPLRLIADSAQTHIVIWTEDKMTAAMRDCPWVVDDLRLLADRFQAHASAGLGPLGERLDDALRAAVYERLQVRVLSPDESVAERGKPLKGLFVVAVGELNVSGLAHKPLRAGEFLFPSCVIGAEPAPHDVKAGPKGGLVLFATRPVAHELMMSVPPLLEILAS
jgi:hypothetical protein